MISTLFKTPAFKVSLSIQLSIVTSCKITNYMLSTYNSTIHIFSVHRGGICARWENGGPNQDWNTVWKTSNPLVLCPVSGLWFRGLRWLHLSSSAAATYISLFNWSHSLHAAPLGRYLSVLISSTSWVSLLQLRLHFHSFTQWLL